MLWTIIGVLAAIWVLGLVTSHTLGGAIHIFLVLAILIALVRGFMGRKDAAGWHRRAG